MWTSPGEQQVRQELPAEWTTDRELAAAALLAAAHLACGNLLPIPGVEGIPAFAVVLEDGRPGVLKLDSLIMFGPAVISIRCHEGAKPVAERLAKRIHDTALSVVQLQQEGAQDTCPF